MKVSTFARIIAGQEGKKVEVNIAQIKEILKIINEFFEGQLYKLIRNEP